MQTFAAKPPAIAPMDDRAGTPSSLTGARAHESTAGTSSTSAPVAFTDVMQGTQRGSAQQSHAAESATSTARYKAEAASAQENTAERNTVSKRHENGKGAHSDEVNVPVPNDSKQGAAEAEQLHQVLDDAHAYYPQVSDAATESSHTQANQPMTDGELITSAPSERVQDNHIKLSNGESSNNEVENSLNVTTQDAEQDTAQTINQHMTMPAASQQAELDKAQALDHQLVIVLNPEVDAPADAQITALDTDSEALYASVIDAAVADQDVDLVQEIVVSNANKTALPEPLAAPASAQTASPQGAGAATTSLANGGEDSALQRLLTADGAQARAQVQDLTLRVAEQLPQHNLDTAKFQAHLNSAVNEIKAQIQAGHTPAINLEDVINSGLTQQGIKSSEIDKAALQNLVSQPLPNLINATSSISTPASAIPLGEQQQLMQAEMRQGQLESAKELGESKPNSALDKAIALSKPEGLQQLTEKVRYMQQNRQMVAEMRLDPAELGSMQIRITMQGDTASVSFVVQQAQARDALMQEQQQLKQMLQEHGLSLGDTSVEQQSAGQQHGDADAQSSAQRGKNRLTDDIDDASRHSGNIIAEQRIVSGNIGGIDFYA
jgi:flagellar hook-length control protein FliK